MALQVGIIGRTNVWKSTLFNALIWSHRAIVTDISWTTKELIQEVRKIWNREYMLIDSPWLDTFEEELPFIEAIIEHSDLLLFVVDWKVEPSSQDEAIKEMIIKAWMKSKTLFLVNKLDWIINGPREDEFMAEWRAWWFEHTSGMSAHHREWLIHVREQIVAVTNSLEDSQKWALTVWSAWMPVVILWKPNAWKSTLLNTLIWEQVAHVSDIPWTTLDYHAASFMFQWTQINLYDTAWIRKKSKNSQLESIAYAKTLSLIEYVTPVVVYLFDSIEWFTKRDGALIDELQTMGVPLLIAFNKIDETDKHHTETKMKRLRSRYPFLHWIPFASISWRDWIGLPAMLKEAVRLHNDSKIRIPTAELNNALKKHWFLSPPTFPKNKICKRKYITQVWVQPPTFMLSVNNVEYANFSFRRWVINAIRDAFWFHGVPVKLTFTSKVNDNPYLDK